MAVEVPEVRAARASIRAVPAPTHKQTATSANPARIKKPLLNLRATFENSFPRRVGPTNNRSPAIQFQLVPTARDSTNPTTKNQFDSSGFDSSVLLRVNAAGGPNELNLKHIALARHQLVEHGVDEKSQEQRRDQAPHDNDGKRPLGIRADAV